MEEEEDTEEKNSKTLLKLKQKSTKSAAGTGKQPVSKANSSKSVSSQGSIQFKKNNKKWISFWITFENVHIINIFKNIWFTLIRERGWN